MQVRRYFWHKQISSCLSSTKRYLRRSVGFQKTTKLWKKNQNKSETRNMTQLSLLYDQIVCETVLKQCEIARKNMEIFFKDTLQFKHKQQNTLVQYGGGTTTRLYSANPFLTLVDPRRKQVYLCSSKRRTRIMIFPKGKIFLCVSSNRQHLKNCWHISL